MLIWKLFWLYWLLWLSDCPQIDIQEYFENNSSGEWCLVLKCSSVCWISRTLTDLSLPWLDSCWAVVSISVCLPLQQYLVYQSLPVRLSPVLDQLCPSILYKMLSPTQTFSILEFCHISFKILMWLSLLVQFTFTATTFTKFYSVRKHAEHVLGWNGVSVMVCVIVWWSVMVKWWYGMVMWQCPCDFLCINVCSHRPAVQLVKCFSQFLFSFTVAFRRGWLCLFWIILLW